MVGKLVMSTGTSWSSRALAMHPAAKDLPVPMSPNSSSPMFRLNAWGQTGQTIQKYLRDIRLSEAKLLLRQTDYSYAAISHMTGFSSQSYFTNIFRRNVGLTPKAFRESDPTHSDFRE